MPFVEVAAITRNYHYRMASRSRGWPSIRRVAAAVSRAQSASRAKSSELSDGGYAWVDVLAVTPQKQKELAEFAIRVRRPGSRREADKALRAMADDLVKRLDAGEDINRSGQCCAAEVNERALRPAHQRTGCPLQR
ncbi:MAG: hypothetical protein R3E48_23180 [Burkholderiaceae bacterium]